jgi:hypothetical protein
MGTNHTPGPWAYRPDEYDDWGCVRAPVTEQGQFRGGIICQASDPEARDAITLAKHREAGTDPWEANARLIAAAPELLEALEECLREHGGFTIKGQCERRARAAIAKARGAS